MKGRGNFVSGKSSLLLEKQRVFWQEYREIVKKGKNFGIEKEEFQRQLDLVWEEE